MSSSSAPPAGQDEAIRTPDQRLRVFVSSTLGELGAERKAVRAAVERLHLTTVVFEAGARPHPPRELYRAYLRQSHVFVGIYCERYGWVAPGEQVSGLEDELRLSDGMPRLLYVKQPTGPVEPGLQALLAGIRDEGSASYRRFTDAAELTALVQQDLATLLSERFMASTPPAETRVHPPPVPLTPTVGREQEVAAVEQLLADGVRLLTVTGPGGVGKSRLALEVAHRQAGRYADGIAFIPLETVTRADLVLRAVADRLGVFDGGQRPLLDVLGEELRQRRMLLVVDNLEQVVAAGPELAELLGRCPGLAALVTSRQPLRLRGEREFHLQPLPVPQEGQPVGECASVDLFVQRATAVAPGFALTESNGPQVARLVRLLDGLPLAIELAAARSRLLPPAALLERLTQRLDVLSGGASDLPPRQRTQRATLDWSLELLSEPEQALFVRMSAFAGGATLDAVEAVCGGPDVLGTASSLLEKSLLVSSVDVEETRVGMLQTVRSRAAELLAERGGTAGLGGRHARWYAGFAAPADVLRHVRAPRHWAALEVEADNLRTALAWASGAEDAQLVGELVRRLWPWLWMTGRVGELRDTVLGALATLPSTAEPGERGFLCCIASIAQTLTGHSTEALELTEQALHSLAEAGDDAVLLTGLTRLVRGTLLADLEGSAGVLADLGAAVRVGRATGNAWLLAYGTSHRGMARAVRGDTAGARADHRESLALATDMGHEVLVAQALGQLALVDVLEGRLDEALDHLQGQAGHLHGTRNLEGLANALDTVACLAAARGQWETAARTAGAAVAVRDRLRLAAWPLIRKHYAATALAARDRLGARAGVLMAEAGGADPWSVAADALRSLAR